MVAASWTVLDCLPKRSSPEWGAACQNRGAARLCTARAGHEAALRKEAPRGAERGCLQAIPWSLGPLRAECCRRLPAASAAVVAQPAAAIAVSATAVSVATTAATARWFVIIEASPPATLVVSLAQRPQLHGLIPRGDGDAHRAIRAEQRERIGHCAHVV